MGPIFSIVGLAANAFQSPPPPSYQDMPTNLKNFRDEETTETEESDTDITGYEDDGDSVDGDSDSGEDSSEESITGF